MYTVHGLGTGEYMVKYTVCILYTELGLGNRAGYVQSFFYHLLKVS